MTLLLALWCLAVASGDDKYPVAVGGETPLQELVYGIWTIPIISWITTIIISIINTVYTFFINAVLTVPALSLGIGGN
jgi:hypothetical protein